MSSFKVRRSIAPPLCTTISYTCGIPGPTPARTLHAADLRNLLEKPPAAHAWHPSPAELHAKVQFFQAKMKTVSCFASHWLRTCARQAFDRRNRSNQIELHPKKTLFPALSTESRSSKA